MTEAPLPAENKPPRKSRFWRWLKRGMLAFLILLVLGAIFHRQLLEWGLNRGAAYFAKREGYTLEWELDGSMLSDIEIKALKVRGPEGSVVVNIQMKDAQLRYDLWKLWREGTGSFLQEVSMADTTIEADIRTNPDKPLPPPKVREKKPPPDVWVDRVSLRNINAIIHTDKGDIVLRDFTLVLDKDHPGELRLAEFVLPAANLKLNDVAGRTEVKGRKLTLADLQVTPDVVIPLLYADVEKLHQGAVDYQVELRSGAGTLESKGRVEGLGTEPSVNSALKITNMAHTEVARWTKLPEGFAIRVDLADIKVKGPLVKPQALDAEVVLQTSGLRVAGYGCDTAELLGTIKAGTMHVGSLKAMSGPNMVETTAEVPLPQTWAEMARASMQIQWKIAAPDLAAVRESPIPLEGRVTGQGTLSLTEGKVSGATANLDATALKLPQVEIAALQANVTTDVNVVKMNAITVRLDDTGRNTARISGQMAIGGRQTTQVEVQGDIADLAALFTTLKLTNMVPPEAGRVVLKTTAAFDLADLREKNLNRATAEGSLGVTSLQWREGRLDAFASTFSLREGLATVRAELNHQGKNTADLNATLRLSDRQPAKVDWVIKLTDLASLVPMAGLKDTPPPVAGTVNSAGSATFDLADVKEKRLERIAATGNLAVRALKWREGILDQMNADFAMRDGAVSLEANLNHANANTASIAGQMQLTGRQATSVKWQANLTALSTLIPLTGLTPPPSAGVVTSQGTAAFDAVDLKEKQYNKVAAQGELLVNALQWRGGTLAKVNAVFNVREGIADLNPGIIQFDEQNQITVRGRMPLDTRQPFQAEVHGRMPRLTSLSPWLAMAKTPPLTSGSAAIDWSGTGVIATGNITGGGTVKVDDLKIKGRAEQYSLALTTKHEGKRAEISELRASAGAFRLEATAAVSETELSVPRLTFYSDKVKLVDGMVQVPLALNQQPRPAVPVDATKPMKVQLKMEKLNFTQVFAAIGKKAPVDGVVSADVDIQGTLPDLRGKVSAVMNGVRADALKGKLEPADVKLNLTLEHDRLAVDTTVTQKPLQPLKVTGGMRLNVETVMKNPKALMDEPVEAEIVLPPSSLASVPRFVPALSKLEGTVAINVKINGSAQKPSWAGTVRTDVTSIALTDVPMDVKDVKAHLDFKDTRIDLSNVSATVAGGKVRIDGGVDAANVKDPVMNLHLVADQALLVRDNTMSFRANADIICKGTLAKSAVNGRVELVRGRVFKEVEFLPLSLPNQLPPPPPAVRAGKAGPPAAPGMLKDWTFDVAVTTRDPIRLLGNVLNGSVLVNVSARGNGAAPAIEGKATLDGAKLSLPFSRLTITRGEIIMTKDNPFDPTIDIQGDSLINNYQVTVYAYGRARDPKLRFTSSPPLPENEIASLLATGSTSGDAGGAEGMAANRAAFLLVSQTYRKLFNKAAPKRRLDEEPSKLTFSVDPLGSSGRGGGGGSGPGVTARYDINPNLQATGSVGGDGFRGLIYYLVRLR